MRVLSLFDGMSCGQLALKKAGVNVSAYYACEIDKHAIKITQKNFPETIQLGDVTKVGFKSIGPIDLVIGGSPCQGFSFAGKQLNFEDPRSKLFFEFVRAINEASPKYFLLENVKMKKESEDVISDYLGVSPVEINSGLVSAQNRKRLYWSNLPVTQPEDKGIKLKDIVLSETIPVALHNIYGGFKEKSVRVFTEKSPTLRTAAGGGHIPYFIKEKLIHSQAAIDYMNRTVHGGRTHWDFKHHSDIRNDKSSALVANLFKGVPYNVFKDWDVIRKFHPVECERLQTLPDNYTDGVSDTQRYKMIGNGWTVDVIAHIFKGLR
jgi:DNA (cytosine-5)-methyltransferase 3A